MGWGDTDPVTNDVFAVSSDVLLDVGYLSSVVCGSIWDGGITDGMSLVCSAQIHKIYS